jgi:hypothetical protein
MSEQQQSNPETYVDIKESYVDEKLREFFETEKNEVNIDNICLFSTMIVEDYNQLSEHKLKGQQKFEAATDLAKRIIEKTVTFVTEDHRRQVVKNIYYNIDAIPQTIQFICRISGNPNLVNANKWVLNKVKKVKEEVVEHKSLLARIFSCSKSASETAESEPTPSTDSTEVVEPEKPAEPPVDKKKLKQEEKRRKAEEKLQKELEEIRMTPEEKEAKIKAAKEAKIQAKKDAEEQKKAAKEAKIQAKKDAEEQKRIEKLKQKEKELQEALDKLKEETQPSSTTEIPLDTEIVQQTTTPEVPVEVQEIEMSDMAVGA